MIKRGFETEKLDKDSLEVLKEKARLARGDILTMTTLAGSGHPGGSMSSLDAYLVLYHFARIKPTEPLWPDRDRIVISHGHTSPGAYAALARAGFFPPEAAVAAFRQVNTAFEGHVERSVPGIEWSTGNLGQGLSAACGLALAARLLKKDFNVYTVMGCGEQQKGQLSEARRFAVKYRLNNLTALVDYNNRQISGCTCEIMPQDIPLCYRADGWEVIEIDGHDFQVVYQALRKATLDREKPWMIMLNTVMGKDVSFMEGKEKYHGAALKQDQYEQALAELRLENRMDEYKSMKGSRSYPKVEIEVKPQILEVKTGQPRTYSSEDKTDNRSAWGKALEDICGLNAEDKGGVPIAVFDCDLASSVKTNEIENKWPDSFFQVGIQEHNAATISGALSTMPVLSFFADFGVFGIDETFNQHRLNAINLTNLKVAITHNGLDVGEDGKTHQCLEYVGLARNIFGTKVIVPADPNQTDRAVRYMSAAPGNFFLCMGRSKLPVILDEDGKPFFAGNYKFEYGKADELRDGDKAAILAMGTMTWRALEAWRMLKEKGIDVKVFNVACPLEIDIKAIKECAETGILITYEDHNAHTGLGAEVAKAVAENCINTRLVCLGVSEYGGSGKPDELFKDMRLDPESLVMACMKLLEEK